MRTCIYVGKSTFLTGTHAYSVQKCCLLAKYDEGAEITVGPELGALTLYQLLFAVEVLQSHLICVV